MTTLVETIVCTAIATIVAREIVVESEYFILLLHNKVEELLVLHNRNLITKDSSEDIIGKKLYLRDDTSGHLIQVMITNERSDSVISLRRV